MNEKVVTLDVRDDIRQGLQPCGKILQAASILKDGETLRLIAPFEPVPLFSLLASKGFSHQAKPLAAGDWEVLFSRTSEPLPAETQQATPAQSACGCSQVVEVDARGLEPPQPMVKILEAVAALPTGASLFARTDRRPMHLYAHLEQRGFIGESEEQTDGSFLTHIRHA
jgi:uncharacterized protein (DUF2249 family)